MGRSLLTALNYFGIKPAAIFQSVFTIAIVLVGALLVFGALKNGQMSNVEPLFKDGIGGTMTVLVMIPFLFVGFDVIPQVASEIKAPPKIIGRILVISIISAVIFYLLIVFGVTAGLSESHLLRLHWQLQMRWSICSESMVRNSSCIRRSCRNYYKLECIYHRRKSNFVCNVHS